MSANSMGGTGARDRKRAEKESRPSLSRSPNEPAPDAEKSTIKTQRTQGVADALAEGRPLGAEYPPGEGLAVCGTCRALPRSKYLKK